MFASVGLAAALTAACGDPAGPGEPGEPITELPRALTAAERELIGASNRFGFALLGELRDAAPDENLFLSPLSAHTALGMALNGARDSTFDALREVLGFQTGGELPSLDEINVSYQGLADLLLDLDPTVEIALANSVWHEATFPFRAAYLSRVQEVFGAEVQGRDFGDPATLDAINGWVEDATSGRIREMLEVIYPNEVMFLLNAIYFKGAWTHPFDPEDTRDAPFHLPDGSTKSVRMMVRSEGEIGIRDDGTVTVADLPYGGGAFRMTIVLPSGDGTLDDLLAGLDAETWDAWTADLSERELPIHLPRFTLEWEEELNDVLKALGMEIAFFPGRANFGEMLDEAFDPQAPGTDLHITKVKQKSFIEVNEEGTEAAAATSVGIGVTSAPVPIVVDRPFLVAIRERLSGTVLFLGVLLDPPSA
ncbi:MAG: serpin family protein [Gemmatimonadota bacterium]